MSSKKWFLSLVVLALSAIGFGQGQQQQQTPNAGSALATSTCQSTFTFGSGPTFFQFCVTVNGNITEFQSPQGFEHIREGSFNEGYGICDFTKSLSERAADLEHLEMVNQLVGGRGGWVQ